MNSDLNVAVHALVYMSHKAATLSSEALAENICTNPARVRKVLARLKKAGLVQTKEGLDGGSVLAKPAGEISLREVSAAMQLNFVFTAWKSGDPDMECLVAAGMADIMDSIYRELDELCKERLEHITVESIEQKIFGKKAGAME